MISATDIHKSYGSLHVLKGINLEIKKGEIVSLVGASGAGKSTLLHILGTLDNPDKGSVAIDGEDITKYRQRKLSAFRNLHIGFVFQQHHLLPEFTALENICMPALISGMTKNKSEKKANDLLDFLGLNDRAGHRPSELSGGEQQRVAVARALINQPKVVFADEPSGNLDTNSAQSLHELFFDLRDKFQQTFVIVTHNEALAAMADRKLTMKDGKIV
jgi:lipoprotein-releasing system ATP-binding protein